MEGQLRKLEEKLSRRDSKVELLKNQLTQVKKREVLLVQEVQRTRQLAADSAAQNSKQFLKMRNHLAATHERERMLRDQIESIRSTTSACTSSILPSPDRQSFGFSPGSVCHSARGPRAEGDLAAPGASTAEVDALHERLRAADENLRAVEAKLTEEIQRRAEGEAKLQEAVDQRAALDGQIAGLAATAAAAPPVQKSALLEELEGRGVFDPALGTVSGACSDAVDYVALLCTLSHILNERALCAPSKQPESPTLSPTDPHPAGVTPADPGPSCVHEADTCADTLELVADPAPTDSPPMPGSTEPPMDTPQINGDNATRTNGGDAYGFNIERREMEYPGPYPTGDDESHAVEKSVVDDCALEKEEEVITGAPTSNGVADTSAPMPETAVPPINTDDAAEEESTGDDAGFASEKVEPEVEPEVSPPAWQAVCALC
eukprot:TRINITY_DN559_c0_g1_i1.p1 TRINITY_DN559_c0_g1~~TRINITY_DN559_c0_g1_i1.p1  ORF type:complete len:464 (+),score=91.60 TRINITY_DN559_c0_g1_i1:92-1393(+)